jgi:16S rRNA (uracil1498-N3)-methyltransferase
MQRYFVSTQQITAESIQITGNDVHHLKNVMRARVGDQVICCDGQGTDYFVEIQQIHSQYILCRILQRLPSQGEPKTEIILAQSLPKGDKFEMILQKGTEIGAVSFLPFISKRTVVKLDQKKSAKKVERWQRIVKEAAEQAHRGRIPDLVAPRSWQELLTEIKNVDLALIAYEKGGQPLQRLLIPSVSRILLIVGPEGGFTEQEIAEATAMGAHALTLGPRILRTETAPLVALSCLLFAKGELGGE